MNPIEPSRKDEYRQYLQSDKWRELRALVLKRSKGFCEFCDAPAVQVHHIKYPKRFGDEDLNDLAACCNRCHETSHGRVPMKVLSGTTKLAKYVPLSGKSFPYLVCDNAKVWSTFEYWRTAFLIPKDLAERFRCSVTAAVAENDEYRARSQDGQEVFRYHAVERAMEMLEQEYQHEQIRDFSRKKWTSQEAELREVVHKNYRALRKWANDLQEEAIASKLTAAKDVQTSATLTPEMLIEAIRQAVAPRLHQHDEKLAAHDLVIGAMKAAAPFLRNHDEFITVRQGAIELGLDPHLLPLARSRLTVCALVGNALVERNTPQGPKQPSRLDGSSVITNFNTYPRGAVYAALREVTGKYDAA